MSVSLGKIGAIKLFIRLSYERLIQQKVFQPERVSSFISW